MKKNENSNFKNLRIYLNLTQLEFGKKLSLSVNKISNMERKIKELDDYTKDKIFTLYKISEKDLQMNVTQFREKLPFFIKKSTIGIENSLPKKKVAPNKGSTSNKKNANSLDRKKDKKEKNPKTKSPSEKKVKKNKRTSKDIIQNANIGKKQVKNKPNNKKTIVKDAKVKAVSKTNNGEIRIFKNILSSKLINSKITKNNEVKFFETKEVENYFLDKKDQEVEINYQKDPTWISLNNKISKTNVKRKKSSILLSSIFTLLITILLLLIIRLNIMENLTWKTFIFSEKRASIFFFNNQHFLEENFRKTLENIFSTPVTLISIGLVISVLAFLTNIFLLVFQTKKYQKTKARRIIKKINFFREDYNKSIKIGEKLFKKNDDSFYYTLQLKSTYFQVKKYSSKKNTIAKAYTPVYLRDINYIFTNSKDVNQHFISFKRKVDFLLPEEVLNVVCEKLLEESLFFEIKI